MFIETKRLIVRDFLEDDIFEAYQYLSDEQVMKFVEPIFSLEQTREFVLTYGCEKNMVFALMEKESKKLIGHMIFHPYDSQDEYEIGWIINSDFWGKGYAAEVSEALIGYAFENLNANRIVAETVEKNVHALSIIQKLGMQENRVRSGTFLKLFEINK
jgi:RimJ/RimL family protein N-acetyltransferase